MYFIPDQSEHFLPKPSVEKFDGDPLDYWGFVNCFQIHIASRVATDDLKLVYIFCCTAIRMFITSLNISLQMLKHTLDTGWCGRSCISDMVFLA